MVRKFILALGITAMTLGTAACNTVRGAAADIDSAADEVDKAT